MSSLNNPNPNPTMEDFPQDFRCPISMELIKDPVTISTGVTYERINIERWFYTYQKKTCPTTMQEIKSFDMTPNHTLKRLILAWQNSHAKPCFWPRFSSKHDELVTLLEAIESTPFKVSCLKKLRSIVEMGDNEVKNDFKRSNGVEALVKVIVHVLVETSDFFAAFRACEEAIGILYQLNFHEDEDESLIYLLMKPECLKSMAMILQRGSSEARFHTVSIFQNMSKIDYHWNYVVQDQGIEFFKSLLDIVSDEICAKASYSALRVLIQVLEASKKSRLKAIEVGAIRTLIELLPDYFNASKCEKTMYLIKLLCESADGRLAFIEHGLGIAAVSKKMLNVSNTTTKCGVKILWLICSFHPTERVLEEMLTFGAVKKLVALLHMSGQSTTKERVVKILKLHGGMWRRHPCFPAELKAYLGLENCR